MKVLAVPVFLLVLSCDAAPTVAVSSSFTPVEADRVRTGVRLWGPVTFVDANASVTVSRWPGDDSAACTYLHSVDLLVGVTLGTSEICLDADALNGNPFPSGGGLPYDGWIGVSAHEFGHSQGIRTHTRETHTVMNAYYGSGADSLTDADWQLYESSH